MANRARPNLFKYSDLCCYQKSACCRLGCINLVVKTGVSMHILSLVGKNTIDITIPLVELQARSLVLVCPLDRQNDLVALRSVLDAAAPNVAITEYYVDDDNAESLDALWQKLREQYRLADLVFNASSGFRHAAMYLGYCAQRDGVAVFTVDRDDNELTWVSLGEIREQPSVCRLNVDTYLRSRGFRVFSQADAHTCKRALERAELGKQLLARKRSKQLEKLTSDLRGNRIQGRNACRLIDFDLRELLMRYGMIDDQGALDRHYLTGRWLEEYLYAQVISWGKAQSVGMSIVVASTQFPDVRNEIDLAFVCNNRLHLISCKSGVFDLRAHTYEMDFIRDELGGYAGRCAIAAPRVHAQKRAGARNAADHPARGEAAISRARLADIAVLTGPELRPDGIGTWLDAFADLIISS